MSLSKKKRKEIKDAANTIGSVIAQQMHSEQQKHNKKSHPLQAHILSGTEAAILRKKKLLIGGTCVFALAILLSFWLLKIKTMLYDVSLAPRQDALSIVGAQEEFGSVLTELERLENLVNTNAQAAITAASSSISQTEEAEEQQTKKDIQAALEELIAAPKHSSSTFEQ